MEMERDCSINRLWKWNGIVWATARQPFMEMERDCLGNHWATTRQPFMEMEGTVWVTTGNRLWKWKGLFG
jgi:hypothetical protein